jgi:hypothetical protein
MRKKALYILLVAVFMMSFSTFCFAAEVTVGGDVEIVYSNTSTDAGGGDVDSAEYTTTDADLNVKVVIDENTEAWLKVNADDETDSDTVQLEEIYVTFKGVGPLDIRVGKQEVAFGQDKDLGIADPLVHEGEVDEKFGVTLSATPIQDSPKIELSIFQNTSDQGAGTKADEPADDGLFNSFAARLTSTRVAGLTAEVSYVVQSWEGLEETPGYNDDTSALSIGVDYTMDPINVFAEYIMANDIDDDTTAAVDYMKDVDVDLLSVGVNFKATPEWSILAQYHNAAFDTPAGGSDPTYDAFSITPRYTMGNGVELALEYLSSTYDHDDGGVTPDEDEDTISARVKYSF